jgi:hypothetical protein
MPRTQINVRLDEALIELLDKKRMALQPELGFIPTRSDVMRFALEEYLGTGKPTTEKPRRRGPK